MSPESRLEHRADGRPSPATTAPFTVAIGVRTLTAGLLIAVLALNGLSMVARTVGDRVVGADVVRLLDVAEEANVTAWFSSLLLLMSAALSGFVATAKVARRESRARHWVGLAVLFAWLSLDEIASIHEMAIEPMRRAFGASGALYFAWVILAIPVLVLLGISFAGFVRDLPGGVRGTFLLAAGVFVLGGLGFEMLGGAFLDVRLGPWTATAAFVTLEELLENIGAVLFISALASFVAQQRDLDPIAVELR